MKRSGLMVAVAATVLVFSLRQDVGAAPPANSAETYKQLNLFGEVFERVRAEYVDEVSDDTLVESAINGMLTSLDPHSNYLNTKNFNDMKVQTRGEFGGLGIEVSMESGLVKVVSPIDDTPAARAGLKPGDLITHLDGDPVQGMTLPEAVEKMRGLIGSEIKLTIRREGKDPFDVKLTRATIKIQSVRSHLEGDTIGYVRVTSFNEQTDVGLNNAMKNLKQQAGNKLAGVILDLRNNPGGAFEAAIGVADAFIDKGDIVIIRGRKPATLKRISATPGDIAQGLPIVALINGGTAREAELVAAGLQDNRRAVLVGTRSFGESSIESVIPLQGNGAIRLTTARFLTPSGQRIQGKGLTPDLTVMPLKLSKLPPGDRLREADLRGALKNTDPTPAGSKDSGGKASAPSLATADIGSAADEQLSEAADVLRGLALVSGRAG